MIKRYTRDDIRDLFARALVNSDGIDEDGEDTQVGNPQAAEKFADAFEVLWNSNPMTYTLSAEDLLCAFGHVATVLEGMANDMNDVVDAQPA